MNSRIHLAWCCIAIVGIMLSLCLYAEEVEMVYAEMEFPLSFVSHIQQYQFNPLSKFQTEVEGRIIRLTCDPLVDIYQITAGQQGYRTGLASWRTIKLRTNQVLNFNLMEAKWPDGRTLSFDDVLFSLEYLKRNPTSWGSSQNLILTEKGPRSLDAYLSDMPNEAPKAGEFYFPVVNKSCFRNADKISEAVVNKTLQNDIGYGRYRIAEVEENRFIKMKRRAEHPYFQNLNPAQGYNRIENIRMHAFPRARIARNEQFIEGRVHLITSATQADVGYIVNAYPKAKISRYSDDSFSSFVINCRHNYLQPPAVRRALNLLFRKRLALRRALGGEGELISGPLPSRNFFYNIAVLPYEDSAEKALAMLTLYRYYGLDVYEDQNKVTIFSKPTPGPAQELEANDRILDVEGQRINSVVEFASALRAVPKEKAARVRVARGERVLVNRVQAGTMPQIGMWNTVMVTEDKIQGFPDLGLIANNPEGKDTLIREVCGALKEDMAKVGITVNIEYLDGLVYYPRMQTGNFDLAFRTLRLTGTPSLYRMFYHKQGDPGITNANYGTYSNEAVNELAWSTRDTTTIAILESAWKRAHVILHHDPPYIFLWSRRNILLYDPRIEIITPGPEYEIPRGYTEINGLINVFNEVHLWAWKELSE